MAYNYFKFLRKVGELGLDFVYDIFGDEGVYIANSYYYYSIYYYYDFYSFSNLFSKNFYNF